MTAGNPVVLGAIAVDADSWKWMKGNTNVPGATGTGNVATLNIVKAVAGDAGNYKVVFTNKLGSTTSTVAAVVVA